MTPAGPLLEAVLDRVPIGTGSGRYGAGASVRPTSAEDAAAVLSAASSEQVGIGFTGSASMWLPEGSSMLEMSSAGMDGIIDWQAEDLTVTVGAGTRVGELEAMLGDRHQTSLLPTGDPERTVGGIVAEGASDFGRLRYGPTRDRVLEVTIATGYGHVVRGGGRLVKNVTGYDLPRVVTGSMGSLGFITSVCLKLWPFKGERRVVAVADPAEALRTLYRPFAVLETESGSCAVIDGSSKDFETQLGVVDRPAALPDRIAEPVVLSVRVGAAQVTRAVKVVVDSGATRWTAQHGVGVIDAGWNDITGDALVSLRSAIDALGGFVVVVRGTVTIATEDRWGVPPQAGVIQQRLRRAFDPAGVCNPAWLRGDS